MSSSLPTTPVGKQQLIDMRAGAILRGHARKSERYLGCPVRLLLTFIVLIKSSMLCAWLVRVSEYYFFDLRCSFISTSLGDEILKRRSLEVLRIPVYASDPPAVNYFDEEHHRRVKRTLESFGSDPRMKPRRERKKSFANLQGVPTTVVTLTNTQLLPVDGDTLRMKTIRNRVEPMSDVTADEDVVEIDIDAPPRVYISKIMSRGAPSLMSVPFEPSTRLSEETRLMWEMDELNYTTYAAAPKTTVVTDVEEKKKEESSIISVIQLTLPSEQPTTTAAPRKSFYSTHTLSTWKLTESPPTTSTTAAPITRVLWIAQGVQTEEEKAFEKQQMVIQEIHREKSTLEQLSDEVPTAAPAPPKVTTTSRPRPVKHGFDRSLDEAIDAGIVSYPPDDFTSQREYGDDGNFQFQLSTFSSSATCIARTMFDLWCVCQLMTLFPYLIGVCVARRSLFVSHLVLDILLLVIGFVYT
ncbi:hypothetical protein Aduo_002316 [Ancylostoma duodenale]